MVVPPPPPPPPPPNQVTGTIQDLGPPIKKIRLGEPKPDLQQPLRIETRVGNFLFMYIKLLTTQFTLLNH